MLFALPYPAEAGAVLPPPLRRRSVIPVPVPGRDVVVGIAAAISIHRVLWEGLYVAIAEANIMHTVVAGPHALWVCCRVAQTCHDRGPLSSTSIEVWIGGIHHQKRLRGELELLSRPRDTPCGAGLVPRVAAVDGLSAV